MGGRTFECLDAVINRYTIVILNVHEILSVYNIFHHYSVYYTYVLHRYRKEQIVEGHTLVQAMVTEPDGSVRVNREVQHAEKIYATLRECREQSGAKKNKGIKMQGYLEKKSEKNKKWKALYFVLLVDGTDTHLYLYDNPKRTKPKGLIDLSCAYLYQVRNTYLSIIRMSIN